MLSDVWCWRVTEDQDVYTSSSISPLPSPLPLSTQLGRIFPQWHGGSRHLTCALLLPSSSPWATPTVSRPFHPHQSQPGVAAISKHQRWRRRSSCTETGQSLLLLLPTRILLNQSRPCARLPISVPRPITQLQPANTGRQETNQSGSSKGWWRREQKVDLNQSGGSACEEVSANADRHLEVSSSGCAS